MKMIGGMMIAVVLMGVGFYVARLDACMPSVQVANVDAKKDFNDLVDRLNQLPVNKGGY